MRTIDNDAVELTYQEYKAEAQKLIDEGWKSFRTYPARPGVIYCKAYNKVLTEYRLLTVTEYVSLRDSGLWAKGVDRLRGSVAATRAKEQKLSTVETKKLAKYDKAVEALIASKKAYKDYESLSKAVDSIIRSMTNL